MNRSGAPVFLAMFLIAGCGEPDPGRTTDFLSPLPGAGASPAPAGSESGGAAPAYELPEGWERVAPASSMRVEEFRLAGKDGDGPAELAVSHFPGTGGSVQANIDRWIGQFSQPDGTPGSQRATTTDLQAGDQTLTLVDVSGTYDPGAMSGGGAPLPGYRMLAAILLTPSGPWFYKLTGPARTVDAWEESFLAFAGSLRLP